MKDVTETEPVPAVASALVTQVVWARPKFKVIVEPDGIV